MVPFDLRLVLACCCSQNFCNSLHARILVNGKTGNIGETCTRCEYFRKHISLGFADALKNSWRMVKAPTKVESNLETWKHEEYYYYYCSVLRWVLARLLGAKKKKFLLIKERFRLTENWQSARCSQGKFYLCSCSQKLTHCSHARKFSQRPWFRFPYNRTRAGNARAIHGNLFPRPPRWHRCVFTFYGPAVFRGKVKKDGEAA